MKSSKKFSDDFGCGLAKKQARKETNMFTDEEIQRIKDMAFESEKQEDFELLMKVADTLSVDVRDYLTKF